MMKPPNTTKAIFRSLTLPALVLLGGCRICADCEDQAYPTYGGIWQRTIRDSGRVGSVFDPAGGLASNLSSRDQPAGADELERDRYEARGGMDREPDELEDPAGSESQPESFSPEDDRQRLKQRERELQQLDLDDIEVPEDQLDRQLEEINRRVIPSDPSPPIL